MYVFLPIAQISVSVPVMVAVGGMVGLLSGLFGVGGGFLLTPLLMFVGISPMVAAGSDAAQIVAASSAGSIAHSKAGTVDYKMGLTLFAGGSIGSFIGVRLLEWFNQFGPANTVIRVLYVVLLGGIGSIMLVESIQTWRRGAYMSERRFQPIPARTRVDSLPFRVWFPKSEIEVSLLLPVAMGILAGILAAMMGVGGGFIMVPLMLYVLRMRMHVVAGTSLFQI
ncbi:MAG: sulfite exporter TauE/SafE family protein, partial [Candidatus Methylomirabilales bacterium]